MSNLLVDNLQNVSDRIRSACARSGRVPTSVRLVGVTKYAPDKAVQDLINLGLCDFGESRVQKLRPRLAKYASVNWHLIGSLQTNKVNQCQGVSLIHSLDRWSLATKINAVAREWGKAQDVLVQVNIANEDSKHGLAREDVVPFVRQVSAECPFVNIRGLMAMAPFIPAEETRLYFRQTNQLFHQVKNGLQLGWDTLSMGMTNDFEVAIEEGATLVRVGTALFAEED